MIVKIKDFECLIDEEDAHFMNEYYWQVIHKWKTYYITARNWRSRKTFYLHRLIVNAPPGQNVDHINGNGLDNRKSNLRFCTTSQNLGNCRIHSTNKSGYKGVSFCNQTKKWRATINVKGKQISLGRHEKIEDAAEAYRNASKKYFKEFANYTRR